MEFSTLMVLGVWLVQAVASTAFLEEKGYSGQAQAGIFLAAVLFPIIGLIVALLLPTQATRVSPPSLLDTVLRDPRDNVYWCKECSFRTKKVMEARRHVHVAPPMPPTAPGSVHGSGPPGTLATEIPRMAVTQVPAASTSLTSEFKTCPDCAEQVRFAARKCRFCGYQFAAVSSPSS